MAHPEITIDELAAHLRMTTRNIRAYQAKGLLPAPELRGRTGYYGPAHIERLEAVRRLQDQGMNLATIAQVIASEGSFAAMVLHQFRPEEPYESTVSDLDGRFKAHDRDAVIKRAESIDLIEVVDDTTIVVLSPTVLRRAEELVGMGIPVEAQLEAVAVARQAAVDTAEAFIHLAADHLTEQVTSGPELDAAAIEAEVERLGLIATDVIHALFRAAMADRIRSLLE
ncbi:MAG: MerR family transcriptional regulator [Actinomycetota bacterium]|nr:MerR family transcriptional regulator [Actinomycetota bacterium]